jgi:hypothetical protein
MYLYCLHRNGGFESPGIKATLHGIESLLHFEGLHL